MENTENLQTNWNICKHPWYGEWCHLTRYHFPSQI